MINVLILTHGDLGAYLLEAAEFIVGKREGVKALGVSPRQSLQQVQQRVVETLKELSNEEGLLVITDLVGGTPCNAILPLVYRLDTVEIICGLNLYLLVSALNHRDRLTLRELRQRVIEDGRKSIVDAKSLLRERIKVTTTS